MSNMRGMEWYNNPTLLKAAYDKYGSLAEAAYQVGGVSPSTLRVKWKQFGFPQLPPGPKPKSGAKEEALRELYDLIYGTKS